MKKIQERCLRILLDDCESDYDALLEKKKSKSTREVKPLGTLAFEIFKIINNTSPKFMKNIFKPKSNTIIRLFEIIVNARKTTKFGNKSLIVLGPKIWNQIPTEIKSETSFLRSEEYFKTWCRPECKCNVCRTFIQQLPKITNNFCYTHVFIALIN